MTSVNSTVDDSSSLISYSAGGWTVSATDAGSSSSANTSTHHVTVQQGATATFNFDGTGVYLVGGHKPTYGNFSVTIDGAVRLGSAYAPTPSNGVLMAFSGLDSGSHTVVLTNRGAGLDLDQIIMQTEVPADQISSNTDKDIGSSNNRPDSSVITAPTATPTKSTNNGAFIGGVVALVAGAFLLLLTAFILWRYLRKVRRRRALDAESNDSDEKLFRGKTIKSLILPRRVLTKKSSINSPNRKNSWQLPLQAPPPHSPISDQWKPPVNSSSSEFQEVPLTYTLRGNMFPSRPSIASTYSRASDPEVPKRQLQEHVPLNWDR